MSTEDIAICSLCKTTFPSHEEILVHTCEELKEEKIEETFEHCEIIANEQLVDQEDFKNKNGFSCPDLSDEFLIFILKQVDDLCENIKTGDPDIKRRLEVNQNLNNAVAFYRSKLDLKKYTLIDTDPNVDIGVESDNGNEVKCVPIVSKALEEKRMKFKSPSKLITRRGNIKAVSDEKEKIEKLKVPELKFKRERHSEESNDEKFEVVKNQCGRHKVLSMAVMMNMPKSTLYDRIRKEGIIFQKRPIEYSWECHFCEMKKNTKDVKKNALLPLLRFNQDVKKFQCFLCNSLFSKKTGLYAHLRSIHKNEMNTKGIMNTKSGENQDCDGSVCKKVYGLGKGKEFWCKKCSEDLQLAKVMRKESKARVCPECGEFRNNLSAHRKDMHYAEKQVCSLCSKEFRSLMLLNFHKKRAHDKVPCTECGKLFGLKSMKRHIDSAHTHNDQKKYKCDVCGKGFIDNLSLSDHNNVHTGEKPYKCKFCSSCFASKGTHGMHERGHLGRGRKSKN